MAALTDLSDLINRLSGGNEGAPESVFFFKGPRVTGGTTAQSPILGRATSLWQYDGIPAAGATPAAVEAPTNTTVGAMPITPAATGKDKFLVNSWVSSQLAGTYVLYDRLLHIGGLSGTVTTAQTVGGTLTRNTGGVGNAIMVEIYTAVGTTATTITASYTNSAGTAGRTTPAMTFGGTNAREAQRIIVLPLATGDVGVQSVQSVTVTATTATAGNFGITIGKPIAFLPVTAQAVPVWRDFVTGLPGMPIISGNACLAMYLLAGNTTAIEVFGGLTFVEK